MDFAMLGYTAPKLSRYFRFSYHLTSIDLMYVALMFRSITEMLDIQCHVVVDN
jgi:hypothetical protein